MVEGSGTTVFLCGLWQCSARTTSPAGQTPDGIGTLTGTYGKKNPAASWGAIGAPVGKSDAASTGRMGKDGAPSTTATGWSVTSSAGSSSETSGLAVSEIWLPQRARAVILPSINSSSPGWRRAFLRVHPGEQIGRAHV